MKIRNGFVSNSSTSSFVLIGFKISNEEANGFYEDDDRDDSITVVDTGDKDSYYAGYEIANSHDEEYLDDTVTSFSEAIEGAKTACAYFDRDEKELQIITGVQVS
jgi:hypothetical protein